MMVLRISRKEFTNSATVSTVLPSLLCTAEAEHGKEDERQQNRFPIFIEIGLAYRQIQVHPVH